jgi:hypothetical protein
VLDVLLDQLPQGKKNSPKRQKSRQNEINTQVSHAATYPCLGKIKGKSLAFTIPYEILQLLSKTLSEKNAAKSVA